MYYDFVPRQKNIEIKMTRGRASEIGVHVRSLEVKDIKEMLREGVHDIVEYNTTGFLVWIPPSECFQYWTWAQPHLVRDGKPYLEDYPADFYLVPYELKAHAGERLIVFERIH